jgi:hypothetical protein
MLLPKREPPGEPVKHTPGGRSRRNRSDMGKVAELARERELRNSDDERGDLESHWAIAEYMAALSIEDCAVDGWAAINAEKVRSLTTRIASAAHLNPEQAAEVQRIIEDETGWLADAAEAERRRAEGREARRRAAAAEIERRRAAYWRRQYEGRPPAAA